MPASKTDIANDASKLDNLEKQVADLRKTHRYFAIMVFMLIASLFLLHKTASVRWLSIDDKQGHTTAWWDAQGLQMFDAKGNTRIKIGIMGEQPYLQLLDENQKIKAQMFLYPDGSGYLMLWDKNGKGMRYPVSKEPMP